MRAYPALLLGGLALALIAPAKSQAASQSRGSRASITSTPSLSLDSVDSPEPLIRQASLTVRAPASTAKNGFTDAPLPDDNVDAPREENHDDDTRLKADFFQRNHHQVGDALAGGAGANDQRRGHGSVAAGVAVAIPID